MDQIEPDLLVRLSVVLASTPHVDPLPLRLCLAFSELLGVDASALTNGYDVSDRTTLCSTGDLAERAEDMQDLLREGPSLDAFRTELPITGLSHAQQVNRWPQVCQMLNHAGSQVLMHAFPMRPAAQVVGVLTAYQSHGRALAVSSAEAEVLAQAVGVAVVSDVEHFEEESQIWEVRDSISQATGMVVAQLPVPPSDALAVLRAHAYARSLTVADVCQLVLSGRLDFKSLNEEQSHD